MATLVLADVARGAGFGRSDPERMFRKMFFLKQKKPKNKSLIFVCTLVMVQCHLPPTSSNVSWM